MLTTGGGVAFVGDFDRRFKAVDVKTGKILWQTRLGNTVQGYPGHVQPGRQAIYRRHHRPWRRQPGAKATTLLTEVHRAATGHVLYVFGLPD